MGGGGGRRKSRQEVLRYFQGCAGHQKEKGGNWRDNEVRPGHFFAHAQGAPWEKKRGSCGVDTRKGSRGRNGCK